MMLLLLIMDGFCILLSTIITVLNTIGSERRREIKRLSVRGELRGQGATPAGIRCLGYVFEESF
jgi:hypothetical protein